MLRIRLAILGSVSAITLLAATASQALEPPTMNLGLLKPQEQWKVGTVEAKGAAYCAMVNKFDKRVVLAFARSPDGYGSLALDFRESFFAPGAQYDVALRPGAGKTRHLSARASSDRSVVVQIGQDAPLFRELASNGDLEVGLPTISASFALRRFSDSYGSLVDCADKIGGKSAAAFPSGAAGKDALAAEIESISGGGTRVADAPRAKAGDFRDMEAQLDREAAAEAEHPAPARKLIATTEAVKVPAIAQESDGDAARRLESQQMARAEEARRAAAALKTEVDSRQKMIASLAESKAAAADSSVADFDRSDRDLKGRIAGAERRRDTVSEKAESGDRAARAQLVVAQEQLAALKQQRGAEEEKLTRALAAAQGEYETRVAALQAERDELKRKLAAATAAAGSAGSAVSAARAEAAAKLAASEGERKDLQLRIDMLGKQNKLLQVALGEQKDRLDAAGSTGQALAAVQAKLAAQQKTHDEETARLQKQLDAASAQYAALQKEYDSVRLAEAADSQKLGAAQGLIARLEARIKAFEAEKPAKTASAEPPKPAVPDNTARNAAEIARLQATLADAEAARKTEAARAERAQADLAAARRQLAAAAAPVSAPARTKIAAVSAGDDSFLSEPPIGSAAPAPRVAAAEPSRFEAIEPAAGAAVPPAPKTGEVVWDALPSGYAAKKEPAQKPAVAVVAAADNFDVPAVPVAPVEAVPEDSAAASPNRAAAFLDRIMAYHRPGAVPPAITADAAPAVKKTPAPRVAAAVKTEPVTAVASPAPAEAAPTLLGENDKVAAPVPASALENIEAAAGAPAPEAAPPAAAPVAAPVALGALLAGAGLQGVAFVPAAAVPGETVQQWTAGPVSGMLEQQPAAGAFGAEVQGYLDRYRDDCKGHLNVSAAPALATPAGTLATATAACDMPGNSYASSFVFLQSGATFSAILHTGVPGDAETVRAAGDRIAAALRASSGLVATAQPVTAFPVQAAAVPAADPGEIASLPPIARQRTSVSYAAPSDEFETAIVQ